MKKNQTEILGVFRSHVLILIRKWIIMLLLAGVFTFVLYLFLPRNTTSIILYIIFLSLLYMCVLTTSYTHWWVNTDIVTHEKLISIRFHGLFHFSIEEYAIWKMHTIDIKQEGFFQNLFSYGNVQISSEIVSDNKADNIVLKNISRCDRLVELLHSHLEVLRKE